MSDVPSARESSAVPVMRAVRSPEPALAASATWAAAAPLGGLVTVALVLFVALALREVATLVVPVLFGLFIALVASPIVGALERRGMRHTLALSFAILGVLAIVLLTFAIVALSIGELVLQVPRYEDRLSVLLAEVRDLLAGMGIKADQDAITSLISPSDLVGLVRPVTSAVPSA